MLTSRTQEVRHGIPGIAAPSGMAFSIASLAGMLGIGGTSFFVPLLTALSVATPTAIGTASALTVPIALAGAYTYIAHGFAVAELPAEALDFVRLQALAGIALGSMVSAPLGVAAGKIGMTVLGT